MAAQHKSLSLPLLWLAAAVVAAAVAVAAGLPHAATPGQLQTLSQAVQSMQRRLDVYKERRADLAAKASDLRAHYRDKVGSVSSALSALTSAISNIDSRQVMSVLVVKNVIENLAAREGMLSANVIWVQDQVTDLKNSLHKFAQKNHAQDEKIARNAKKQVLMGASLSRALTATFAGKQEIIRSLSSNAELVQARMLSQKCSSGEVSLNLTGREMAETETSLSLETFEGESKGVPSVFCAITSINSTVNEQDQSWHTGGHGGQNQRKENTGFSLDCIPEDGKVKLVAVDSSRSEKNFDKILALNVRFRTCSLDGAPQPQGSSVCTFSNGLCGWRQDAGDDFDWTSNQGGTNTANTGPSAGHTTGDFYDTYMYTEGTPFANTAGGQKARLVSPVFPAGVQYCFNFWYHIRTLYANPKLTVYVSSGGSLGPALWSRAGHQLDVWRQAIVPIPAQPAPASVVVEVTLSTFGDIYNGDIAIDDISTTVGPCPGTPPQATGLDCTFENDPILCGWRQDFSDDADWDPWQGETPSTNTGPSADHTIGDASGTYLYIEGSNFPAFNGGQKIRLVSPVIPATPVDYCFNFWYSMIVANDPVLTVYFASDIGSLGSPLWSRTGNQGGWLEASVTLPAQMDDASVVIEAMTAPPRGATFLGDMAIDDVSITLGPCAPAQLANDARQLAESLELARSGAFNVTLTPTDTAPATETE